MTSLWRRLAGFAGLPMISLVTPLLVLPVVGRVAGSAGWASLASGESIGTLAGIVIAYGWNVAGPPRVAATADPGTRIRLYHESLVVRGVLAVACVPVIALLCLLVAADGYLLPTVLMGLSGAVVGLSFSWFSVGAGDPRSIAVFEAVPRVAAAMVAALLVLLTRELALYPLLAIGASLGGVVVFSRRVLRGADLPRLGRRDVWSLLVRDRALAAIDVAGGAYGAVPVPLVSAQSPVADASAYASADKLYKFGMYVPITLGNALQSWTVEGGVGELARRLRFALRAHVLVGVLGWAVFALAGPPVSALLFGPAVEAHRIVCFWLGASFLLASTRTSLTRHVLVPAGRIRVVFASTVVGALVGIPLIALLTSALGAVGGALGVLASELVATSILVPGALRRIRDVGRVGPAAAAQADQPESEGEQP